jgi:DAK2 domain
VPERPPMAELERLTDAQLRSVMVCYRDLLGSHQQALSRLNVYPVPDADTGTNMTLTVKSVAAPLEEATDMASTCRAISWGALLGGRRISGVILAQLLGAAASRFAHSDSIDGSVLAQALTEASRAADQAVAQPVEGTILTVARAAARAAVTAAESRRLAGVLDAARAAAYDALQRTPELLPALQRAGVVDAGGAGFILLLDSSEGRVDERRAAWDRIGARWWWSAGTMCGAAMSTPTTSTGYSRPCGPGAGRGRFGSPTWSSRLPSKATAAPSPTGSGIRFARRWSPPPVPESVSCSAPWAPAGRWPPGRCVPPPASCWRRSRRHRQERSSSCPTTGGSSRRPSRPPPCPAGRCGSCRPARRRRGWSRCLAMTLAPALRTMPGRWRPRQPGSARGTGHPGDPRRHLGGR